ncbi:MAG: FAD-dependent monooxygenase [Pseudomonadota bacterium]
MTVTEMAVFATPRPIAVVGRGPAGLAAACLLAEAGLECVLIGPAQTQADRRTVAIMMPAVRMLDRLGAWPHDHSAPLRALRIVDDTDRLMRAPEACFEASEIGETAFAQSVPADRLIDALSERVQAEPRITLIDATVDRLESEPGANRLVLTDGRVIEAALVIAADGRNSPCRAGAGLTMRMRPYPQTAIVYDITHERDHRGVSTEFHRRSGPFTLVPIAETRCGVVSVEDTAGADRILALDDRALAREVEMRSHRLLGRVEIASPRRTYPLVHATASAYAKSGVLLVAEAAHVMPPIGAQGLNLGLRDVAAAVGAVIDHCKSGQPDIAATERDYSASRSLDIGMRMTGVDILNRSLLSNLLPLQAARSVGLGLLSSVGPLRRLFMREGMAPSMILPRLMREAA